MPNTTLKRPPSTSLFIALFCTLFSVIFSYTLSIMASPYIVGDLGGSNDIASYTVSFFSLGNALGIPLGRPLLPRIGAARLLVLCVVLFACFTGACAIAPTYPVFNACRFLQGFVSGPFYILCFYLFSLLQPQEKRGIFSSITLMLFTTGPVIGACWGGWLAYEWQWRWIFHLNVLPLLFLALFLHYRLKGLNSATFPKTPFDGIGYLSYFVGIFCLSTAVIMGQELDWLRSPLFIILGIIGIPSLLFFLLWEPLHPHPLLNLKLLRRPSLFFGLFNLAVLFSAYFGMVILLSLWLKLWVNYTPDWIAALLGIMALTGLFPFFLIDKRISRIDSRFLLSLAIVFLILSCLHTMLFNVDIDFGRIATSRLLAGIGLCFFLPPIFKLCFHNLQGEEMLHTLGLFQITRALASGLGASLYAVLWQRRQVFFHDRLGSQLTPLSEQTQAFLQGAEALGLPKESIPAQLNFYLEREATSLALNDCFYFMAWVLIALLLTCALSFLTKRSAFATEAS
jgi:MFS transporter, DHA2 family, multidrug resistance protein